MQVSRDHNLVSWLYGTKLNAYGICIQEVASVFMKKRQPELNMRGKEGTLGCNVRTFLVTLNH